MVVLMDKYLPKEKILNIWEELNMLNIMKVAEEKGERGTYLKNENHLDQNVHTFF